MGQGQRRRVALHRAARGALGAAQGLGRGARRAAALAGGGLLSGGGRPGRDHRADPAAAAARRGAHADPLDGLARHPAPAGGRGEEGRGPGRLGRDGGGGPAGLQQAPDRRLPRRRQPEARHPRAVAGHRHRGAAAGAPADGGLDARDDELCQAGAVERSRRRPEPPLSVLPRPSAGGPGRNLGRSRRLAGRVEMGRHPRPADPPRRRDLPVEPRRGTDHAAFPGIRAASGFPAGRHGDRRRDPRLGSRGGPAPALRPAAEADRPQDRAEEAARRGPRADAGL